MPSLNTGPIPMDVDTSNKSLQINAMLLRAWRERWTDAQWGTNIKTVRSVFQYSIILFSFSTHISWIRILGFTKRDLW